MLRCAHAPDLNDQPRLLSSQLVSILLQRVEKDERVFCWLVDLLKVLLGEMAQTWRGYHRSEVAVFDLDRDVEELLAVVETGREARSQVQRCFTRFHQHHRLELRASHVTRPFNTMIRSDTACLINERSYTCQTMTSSRFVCKTCATAWYLAFLHSDTLLAWLTQPFRRLTLSQRRSARAASSSFMQDDSKSLLDDRLPDREVRARGNAPIAKVASTQNGLSWGQQRGSRRTHE